ncbi:MAG: hypothetical protein KKG73_08840 [Gammaproteobacteria bacterium]|nr:hypothetical protein [Gammaproteobacteria bacterium]
MYRVYILKQRKGGSEVLSETRTQTPSFAAAAAAFWSLHGADYDESHLLLMSKNNKQLNAFRFKSKPGEQDYIEHGEALKQ